MRELPSGAGPLWHFGASAGGRWLAASRAVAPHPARSAATGSASNSRRRGCLTSTRVAAAAYFRIGTTSSPFCASYLPTAKLRSDEVDEPALPAPQTAYAHRRSHIPAASAARSAV